MPNLSITINNAGKIRIAETVIFTVESQSTGALTVKVNGKEATKGNGNEYSIDNLDAACSYTITVESN